ncbi:hypothetical protein [Parageobacillus sp. G301]|uniref:hypothetical protein n=1 Tax=Parageobacillus sp. G301 TaxID=2998290 RepID=UPI0024995EA1|nr:hypothetical protein [Parageobacillus sp. G301]GLH62376.1 hypothetical protein PG301_02160 [Parageobacillus sp. G301]
MRKHTIIEHHQFKQILQYRPAVTSETDRNRIKMDMLQSIIQAIGEKWLRMKQETKSALEYLCFLSIERGFVYAGSQHVGERYDIDSRTVRRYLLLLEQKRVLRRLWRSSTKQNGRGKAVIFFTAHPYYEKYWQTLFFWHECDQAHVQAKSVQNARKIEGSDEQNLSLPNTSPDLQINKNNNHLNVNHSKKGTFVKFVCKEVNRIASGLFNAETIKSAWNRVTLAFRKAIQKFGDIITHADRKRVAIITFTALKDYFVKAKGQIQSDEICALAYSIASNQFEQLYHSRQSFKTKQIIVRREMLPDWFEEHQKQFEQSCQQTEKEVYSDEEIQQLRERLAKYRE